MKITAAALAAAAVLLGVLLLAGVGRDHQRAMRTEAVEQALPAALRKAGASRIDAASCAQRTGLELQCIVTAPGERPVPVSVTLDPSRSTFAWKVQQ